MGKSRKDTKIVGEFLIDLLQAHKVELQERDLVC